MKIAIIGGGISGLVSAKRLSDIGNEVTIFEKENFSGGLTGDFEISGTKLEKIYHHIFKTDIDVINLIKELDLDDKLKWYKSSVGVYSNNAVHPFSGAFDLLKFPSLDLISKFKLGMVYLWLKFDNNWKRYINVSASQWMVKMVGKRAYETIWEPLLKGKFHNYSDDVSMAWLWARIHTRGGSTNEKGEEVLGYIDGGFGKIIDVLIAKIIKNKGVLKLDSPVDLIKEKSNGKVIIKSKGKDYIFDRVLAAIPNDAFSEMLDKNKYKRYFNKLNKIKYLGAITIVFSSNQSLSNYYWHNINDLKSPFLVFVQHTNLVNKKKYSNKNIYYMGTYLPQDHKYFSYTDRELKKEFFNYLKKLFPKFVSNKNIDFFVFKFKNAQHIVDLEYSNKIPKYKTPLKNVFLLNFSQIYPEDRGLNFAVKEANKIVKMM